VLSARPGRILADLSPEFDRQVSLDTIRTQPAFTQTFHQIWQLIRTEVVAQMHEGVS